VAGARPKSARQVASEVLNRFDPARNYAAAILEPLLDQTDQRQRATDLVFGTIRNRRAIDAVITVFSSRRIERIPPGLLNVIRVGCFELVYNPRTAGYSAVNDAVEIAKRRFGARQAGFVNAVLRNITRHISEPQKPLAEAEPEKTLPQSAATGCSFDTPLLPSPRSDPVGYLAAAFSLPGWLVADWLAEFGFEQARRICLGSNRRPSVHLRPNTLKTTAEELASMLAEKGIEHEFVSSAAVPMLRLKGAAAVSALPGFAEGLFTVQDLSAARAAVMLKPRVDTRILDLCAAPGTKTTQLAELTGGSARIIATDIDSRRLEKIEQNVSRLELENVEIVPYERLEQRRSELGSFDAVMVDAPCSNTGVLAKRIEARFRLGRAKLVELVETQKKLLFEAAAMTGPGGRICYSTCSIQRLENSRLIEDFLRQNEAFELESESLVLPSCGSADARDVCGQALGGCDHDGGYVAVLVRR